MGLGFLNEGLFYCVLYLKKFPLYHSCLVFMITAGICHVVIGIIKLLKCSNSLLCNVALMKLDDDDQSVLQVIVAILITILWGLMVVFPFIQVSTYVCVHIH